MDAFARYFCLDPNSTNFDACGVQYPEYIGDSWCDWDEDGAYNSDKCGWDGGDCCPSSCGEGEGGNAPEHGYRCGSYGYDCQDPKRASTLVDGNSTSAYAAIGSGLRNIISADSLYSAIDGGAGNQVSERVSEFE